MTAFLRPDPYASDKDWEAAGFPIPKPNADYRVATVSVVGPLTLWVEHKDGAQGKVRFEASALQGLKAPLADPTFFERIKLDGGAVTWPGEIDISPDNMHRHLAAFGEWVIT